MIIRKIDNNKLLNAVEILKSHWNISDDYEIYASKGKNLTIKYDENKIYITYPLEASFLRAVTLVSLALSKGEKKDIEETLYLDECGIMFDLSRNGVMKVESVKKYAEYMALMGLNQIYLYLEETYEIEGKPYFGYMRGRYTKEELKEIDEYCDMLGIEVVPHIQTLGHMEQYLKWVEADSVRDTPNILLAGEDTTYEFIKQAIQSISSCFKTNKIHLGMDEAGNLGSGKYYALHGAVDRKDILIDHMERVCKIAEEAGLVPVIYGDIIYAVATGTQNAKEGVTELPLEFKEKLPKNFIPVYWNYYSEDYEYYKKMLKAYSSISKNVKFWGGIWTWLGPAYDAVMTEKLSNPALMACKDIGVRSAIGSAWGDDGCECNFFLSLHGCMYFAEHMYNKEVDDELFKERFEGILKVPYDAFVKMSYFHNDYDNFNDYTHYLHRYMGKRYLWADILTGLLDEDLRIKPMAEYYKSLYEKYQSFIGKYEAWDEELTFISELIYTLYKKCYVIENLRKAYLENNKEFLEKSVKEILPELKECYKKICTLHRKQWYKVLKPFGFEVLDVRYGGIINRIETAILRINQYLNGEIDTIDEFDSARLLHRCGGNQRKFAGIISASNKI